MFKTNIPGKELLQEAIKSKVDKKLLGQPIPGLKSLKTYLKGGSGSGNYGHQGRPGERGGSGPGGKEEIIIISDNPSTRDRVLDQMGSRYSSQYNVVAVDTIDARKYLDGSNNVAMVVADTKLNGQSGVELLSTVHDKNPTAQRILLRDNLDINQRREVAKASLAGLIDSQVPNGSNPEAGLYPVTSTQLGVRARILDPGSHSEADLSLGIKDLPAKEHYDVAVIGGGPAGLTAGVHSGFEGLDTVVLTNGPHSMGGQAGQTSMIRNYASYPNGVTGTDLTHDMVEQTVNVGTEIASGRAVGISRVGEQYHLKIQTMDKKRWKNITVDHVVLANGADFRKLHSPGIDDLVGHGVSYGPPSLRDALNMTGDEVFMVGGGNSVAQAAMNVSKFTNANILVRGPQLSEMSTAMANQIAQNKRIKVWPSTEVVKAIGVDGKLAHLELKDRVSGIVRTVPADKLHLMIGTGPRTEWLKNSQIKLDPGGHVLTGLELAEGTKPFQTNWPGVFAIGDVRSDPASRVQAVTGEGAAVVKNILRIRAAKAKKP